MLPPVPEVQRSNGRKIPRLREPATGENTRNTNGAAANALNGIQGRYDEPPVSGQNYRPGNSHGE